METLCENKCNVASGKGKEMVGKGEEKKKDESST